MTVQELINILNHIGNRTLEIVVENPDDPCTQYDVKYVEIKPDVIKLNLYT